MATRSGGRNDDRSSQRNTGTGQRGSGSAGGARGASGSVGRGTTSASGSSNSRGGSSAGGTSGRGASTVGGASSGTRARGPSGDPSTPSAGFGGSSASSPTMGSGLNQSESAGPSTYSTDAPTTASESSAGQSSTSPGASSGGTASSTSAERERELRTSREVGGSSRPVSSARSGIRQQGGGSHPSQMFSGGGNTPFAMMRRMMDDMDRLFSEFGFIHPGQIASGLLSGDLWPSSHASPRNLGAGSSGSAGVAPQQPRGQQGLQRGAQGSGLQSVQGLGLWSPQVEMFERGNNLVVRADLPGLSREDVDVEVDEDALIIRGERRNELDDEQEGYYRSERSYGSFYRAIPLPENVDPTNCQATFRDGVLEITLPKPQPSITKAKRIEVR